VSFDRRHLAVPFALLATVALLVGCGGAAPGSAPSSVPSSAPTSAPSSLPSGSIHLLISKTFDNRADEADLWNSGTISADGVFPASRLDTMDGGVIYDGNDIGTWSASTQQQSGDFEGECNGSEDCHPCVSTYGGSWPIDSIDFTVQERGNGRYVIDFWFGNELPPKTGGCDSVFGEPVTWADNLRVTLTGIGTAAPAATAVGTESSTGPYEIQVTQ
jgi:hypothetical protein